MKNKLLLISIFFLCLACSENSDILKKDQTKPSAATSDGKNKGSAGARIDNGSGIWYTVQNTWGAPQWTFKGDFDGDKKCDIISLSGTAAYVKRSQGLNASSFLSQTWYTNGSYTAYTFVGDFNGDGYSDIASANGGNVIMKINNKNGSFSDQNWAVSNLWGARAYTFVGDFNNDGKTDIASANGSNTYIHFSTGSGFQSVNWPNDNQWSDGAWTFAGDFTGDGKCDIVTINPGAGLMYLKENVGNGFACYKRGTLTTNWGSSGYTLVGDRDGSHKAHVYSANGNQVYDRWWLSQNDYWHDAWWNTAPTWGSAGYQFFADFDGDGADELLSCIGDHIYAHY